MRIAYNEHGRRIGQSHPQAILSDRDVELLHELAGAKDMRGRYRYPLRWLAAKFDAPVRTIRDILEGRRRCQTPARVELCA